MGFLKRNNDPLTKRARDLRRQIGKLEEEIRRLTQTHGADESNGHSHRSYREPARRPAHGFPTRPPESIQGEAIPQLGAHAPKIRSTTKPRGETTLHTRVIEADAEIATAPIFEEVKQNPFRIHDDEMPDPPGKELGIRRHDWASLWRRLKNHLRGPVTSNPKLVNYLAAGSIQGLQPLRYEKRVARNRFIALVVILVMILWGVLALLLKR